MTAKLMNDICRCTGDTEINGEVKICPARNKCLRYLERETFRGRVYQYSIMAAPSIKESGCDSLITVMNNKLIDTGDRVLHEPSQEEWIVSYTDYETGRLSWLGWPQGREVYISDCRLIKKASEEDRQKLFVEITEQLNSNSKAYRFASEQIKKRQTAQQLRQGE